MFISCSILEFSHGFYLASYLKLIPIDRRSYSPSVSLPGILTISAVALGGRLALGG